jgi:hypothetical protein
MINKTKKLLNFLIMLIGLAVLVRSVIAAGTLSITTGVVAGLAFTAYGAVRLYYFRGRS